MKTYQNMVSEEGWIGKDQIEIPTLQALAHSRSVTFRSSIENCIGGEAYVNQLALLIIGRCGFGFLLNWADPSRTEDKEMTLQEAFQIVSESGVIDIIVPKWVQKLVLLRM